MLRVGIVDDHQLFRKSMTLLVNSFEGMKMVVDAENGKVFLNKLEKETLDVILLDIQMPVMDGYETCKELLNQFPNVKILIISQLTSRESIHKIMHLGAHGYFTKNSNPDQLKLAIKNVHEEGFYFGLELGSVIREVLLMEKKKTASVINIKELFSDRELEIIKLICKQFKSKEIADKLFIHIRTVDSHRKHVMEKSKSKNIIGVILFALKHKIITVEEL